MIKVRFAPSPTGQLHVGNVRIAILNYLFARKNGGSFVLRIDDTDTERSTKESENLIMEDLKWLGIKWDEFHRQSARFGRYDEVIEYLKKIGRLYPCYETKEELSLKRKIQSSQGIPPVYDREALRLTDEQIRRYEEEGRRPYWRFKLNEREVIEWEDLVHGKITIPLSSVSDPVLTKPDGGYIYTLASVVDDIDMGITHIIRGDDHITNTAVQSDMFMAISGARPNFGHLPLMSSLDGADISKRTSSPLSIVNMRKEGIEPMAIWNILAMLGTANNPNPDYTIDDLIEKFSFEKRSLAAVKFNMEDVRGLTKKIIAKKNFAEVKDKLRNLSHATEEFWCTIRDNVKNINEASHWHQIFFGKIEMQPQDKNFVQQMLDVLTSDFDDWIANLKKISQRKGRDLFHPIRMVLTGEENGPELKKIFNLIGPEQVKNRIKQNLES